MTTTDPTTTSETTPPEPPPTPASKLEPDDGSAPLGTVQFFCGACGQEIKPTAIRDDSELRRPQSRYTYSCLGCDSSGGATAGRFDLVVFHESRQT